MKNQERSFDLEPSVIVLGVLYAAGWATLLASLGGLV